jgi:hypothetical protein
MEYRSTGWRLGGRRAMAAFAIIVVFACAQAWRHPVFADPGDTTTVVTFSSEFHNWASPHVARFAFPDSTHHYAKINMYYRIACPDAPGDCDPWDRLATLSVIRPMGDSTESLEIARMVTPYDITGNGGPGSCAWLYDASAYAPLLHDSVTLSSFITTWIGGDRGWLITVTFELIEGTPAKEAFRVIKLWDRPYLVYGDPDNPPASYLPPDTVRLDDITDSVTVRVITTGHGQGNTSNAAEFTRKRHTVAVDDIGYVQDLWRVDCGTNPCSPQSGTWTYNRAGWCPGSSVVPFDVSPTFSPGGDLVVEYRLANYENYCRPTNPNCVSGSTCSDCNYNSTGHTEPNYCTQGQLILYRTPVNPVQDDGPAVPANLILDQNFPNPFNPETVIPFALSRESRIHLNVYNLNGRVVANLINGQYPAGNHSIRFDGRALASGVYFCTLSTPGTSVTRKMLLLK